ncbi:MAG: FliM/FliN family flagellar motor switch protein [Novosphingobium sp.]
MKSEHAFVAERAAAQHCAALIPASPVAADLLPQLTRLGERWAKRLARALAAVTGGHAPTLYPQAAQASDAVTLAGEIGALGANGLYAAGPQQVPVLVSVEGGAVLALVDRTFGGRGDIPASLPDAFAMSADLMIARLETLIAASLVDVLEGAEAAECSLIRRDGNLAALSPFPPKAGLATLRVEVAEPGRKLWVITFAVEESSLPRLLGNSTAPAKAAKASPFDEPFADLPLELSAVLVDMRISMATIAAIQPGSVLPVSVARNVPLKIGGKTIATGSVGDSDDRVAIRITQAFA